MTHITIAACLLASAGAAEAACTFQPCQIMR